MPITLETIQSISGAFHQYSQNVQNLGGDTNSSPSNSTNHIFRSNTDLYRLASDAVEQLRTPGKEPIKKRKYQKRGEESSHKNNSSHRTPLSQLQNNKNDTVGVDSTAVTSTARNFRSSFRRNKNKLKQKALNFKENEDELYSSNIIEGRDSKENEENSYSADHRKNLNLSSYLTFLFLLISKLKQSVPDLMLLNQKVKIIYLTAIKFLYNIITSFQMDIIQKLT